MSKDAVSDWDTTAANNTDIGGISLAEGVTLPSYINNALRVMMAQIATEGFISTGTAVAFSDTLFTITDNSDATKIAAFQASSISTGTTRTFTFPDASGTFYVSGGTDVAVADGGTNLSSYTAGDLIYASATTTLSKLAKGTAGQALVMNSGATAPEWADTAGAITIGTAQASTSGTAIDFTSIPAGTKRITVGFIGVSSSGTSVKMLQIGDSGGIETADYNGAGVTFSANAAVAWGGSGAELGASSAADRFWHGAITLTLIDDATNTWSITSLLGGTANSLFDRAAGTKALSATLDRVRITHVNGSDTFDAGSINIAYEG